MSRNTHLQQLLIRALLELSFVILQEMSRIQEQKQDQEQKQRGYRLQPIWSAKRAERLQLHRLPYL